MLTIDRIGINYRLDRGHFTSSIDVMLPTYMQTALNAVRGYLNTACPRWRRLVIAGDDAVVVTGNGRTCAIPVTELPQMDSVRKWIATEREWLLAPEDGEEEIAWQNAQSRGDSEEIPRWLVDLKRSETPSSESGSDRTERRPGRSTSSPCGSGGTELLGRLFSLLGRVTS